MHAGLQFPRPLGFMLIVTITDKFRADADEWLGRAAQMPVGSWDRERLTTAAKLNYAFAKLLDRRDGRSDPLNLDNSALVPFRRLREHRRAFPEKAGHRAKTTCDQSRSAGTASSS